MVSRVTWFLVLAKACAHLAIPAAIDWRDFIYVNGLVYNGAGYRRNVPLIASLTNAEMVVSGPRIEHTFVSLPIRQNGVGAHYIESEFSFQDAEYSLLPLGQSSRYQTEFGDVAVIRSFDNRNASIKFGVSNSRFEQEFCEPGSVISLSSVTGNVAATVRIGSSSISRFEYIFAQGSMDQTPGALLSVPSHLFDLIRQTLISNGAQFVSDNFFTNCTPDSLRGLDDVHVEFNQAWSPVGLGSLIFTPEDYLAFNAETIQCYLKIIPSSERRFVRLNTFAMRGINTRVSHNTFELCDSSI